MEILKFLNGHWSDFLGLVTLIGGWLGLRHRAAKQQATWQQVERWANAAADAVILWIQRTGTAVDAADVIERWRERLLEFATAVGFDVSPNDMKRALAIASQRVGTVALQHNIEQLDRVAEAMRLKMVNGAAAPIGKTERVDRTARASVQPPFGKPAP